MYSGTPLGWLIVACFSTCSSLLIKTVQTLGGSRLLCISKTTGRLFFIHGRSTAQHGGESTSVRTGNKTEAVSFICWPVEFLRKVLFTLFNWEAPAWMWNCKTESYWAKVWFFWLGEKRREEKKKYVLYEIIKWDQKKWLHTMLFSTISHQNSAFQESEIRPFFLLVSY